MGVPGTPDFQTLSSLLSLGLSDTAVQEADGEDAPPAFGRLRDRDIVPVCSIAHSAMSRVWRAVDRRTQRDVVVKMLPDSADNMVRQFLRNESFVLRELIHPGIVGLIEAELEGDEPYLVMGYVEGQTLGEVLHQGAFRPRPRMVVSESQGPRDESPTGWGLYRELLQIVSYLHRRDVVHRDLKPANVLVDPFGGMTLIDFGLAARVDHRALAALPVIQVVGSRRYMAPELLGQPGIGPDPRQDVYALGRILEDFLRQWSGDRQAEGYRLRRLRQLVAECCSPHPGARPANASAVLHRFEKMMQQSTRRLARVGPLAAVLGLALLVASVVAWDEWGNWTPGGSLIPDELVVDHQEPILPIGTMQRVIDLLEQRRLADARSLLGNVATSDRGWTWHHLQQRLRVEEGVEGSSAYQHSGVPDYRLLGGDISPVGDRCVVLTAERLIYEGAAGDMALLSVPGALRVEALSYDASGRYLVVATHRHDGYAVDVWDTASQVWIRSLKLKGFVSIFKVARVQHAHAILIHGSDGQHVRCDELDTRIWQTRSLHIDGLPVLRIPSDRPLVTQVIDANQRQTQLTIWDDWSKGKPLFSQAIPSVPAAVDVSLHARRVAVITREAVLKIYDLDSQALLARRLLPATLSSAARLMFDPVGKELVVLNADWSQVYEVRDLKCLATLPEGAKLRHCVAMTMGYTVPAIQVLAGNGIHQWYTDPNIYSEGFP